MLLQSLIAAGAEGILADTGDPEELAKLESDLGCLPPQLVGCTSNQKFLLGALTRGLGSGLVTDACPRPTEDDADAYTALCAGVGRLLARAVPAGQPWEVSLPLPTGLSADIHGALRFGQEIREKVPRAIIKICFAPHAPGCLLVARALERMGIPVNLTCTFSARQVALAALVAGASRTNVFVGRLNRGLRADGMGEQVALSAQRWLWAVRDREGLATRLIVASVSRLETLVETAGCDLLTAPCSVLAEASTQTALPEGQVSSRIGIAGTERTGQAGSLVTEVGRDRIEELCRVEPELVEFLLEARNRRELHQLCDGDVLARRLEDAGFSGLFYSPSELEWSEIRRDKLPDPAGRLIRKLPLDTLFSLLAWADFDSYQERIAVELAAKKERGTAGLRA